MENPMFYLIFIYLKCQLSLFGFFLAHDISKVSLNYFFFFFFAFCDLICLRQTCLKPMSKANTQEAGETNDMLPEGDLVYRFPMLMADIWFRTNKKVRHRRSLEP